MSDLRHAFVRANNITFHVAQIDQDAPLILFLHGFPECWYSWQHQLVAVSKAGSRAWAPDLRGFNLSDTPLGIAAYHLNTLELDIHELLNAAGVERAVLVGHDWGALMAWRFAMDYPERVDRLVIMNVPHPGSYGAGMRMPQQWAKSWYIAAFQIPYLPEHLITMNPRRAAEALRETAVRKQTFSDADLDVYASAIAQPGAVHAALNYYRALVRWGFRLPIKQIDAPTLMLWGEEDIALRKELTYGTEQWVTDFRIHYIPNCGHWVQTEAAEEVNEQLLEFLK